MQDLITQLIQDPNQLLYCQLRHLGSITIQGKDSGKLLQGLLTCDIREVDQQQCRWGAFCNSKGRILSHTFVFKIAEDYLLLLPQSNITAILAHLNKYAVFSQVTIQDSSHAWQAIGFIDKSPIPLLSPFSDDKASTRYPLKHLGLLHLVQISEKPWRYLGIYPSQEPIVSLPLPLQLKEINADGWTLLDIQAGFAAIYPETSQAFMPHELNYPLLNGVSFSKGCYLGQEIIARLEHRGNLKHRLVMRWLYADEFPLRGSLLLDNNHNPVSLVIDRASINSKQYAILVLLNEYYANLPFIDLAIPENARISL